MTTIYSSADKYTFPYPKDWAVIGRGDFYGSNPLKVYSAFHNGELVAYGTVDKSYYNQCTGAEDSLRELYEIITLEVKPEHQRQGHGRKIMTMMLEDFSMYDLLVESTSTPQTKGFYQSFGFRLWWRDLGQQLNKLIRLANFNRSYLQELNERLENSDDWYPEYDLTHSGSKWDVTQQRFIHPDRTYAEEVAAVTKDPFEISTVKEQTLELQMIVALSFPDALTEVTEVHPSVRIPALQTRWSCEGLGEVENYSLEELIVFEEGRQKYIENKYNKNKKSLY